MARTRALAVPEKSAIMRLEDVVEVRGTWVEAKRRELADAEAAVDALRSLAEVPAFRIKRAVARAGLLRKVVRALERGFIPIPRFSSRRLDVRFDELPVRAIAALGEAQALGIFDEIRFVAGDEGEHRRGRRRRATRDPLLVGVVRIPATAVPGSDRGWGQTWIPGVEEHFLVAYWRPEEERYEVMF